MPHISNEFMRIFYVLFIIFHTLLFVCYCQSKRWEYFFTICSIRLSAHSDVNGSFGVCGWNEGKRSTYLNEIWRFFDSWWMQKSGFERINSHLFQQSWRKNHVGFDRNWVFIDPALSIQVSKLIFRLNIHSILHCSQKFIIKQEIKTQRDQWKPQKTPA